VGPCLCRLSSTWWDGSVQILEWKRRGVRMTVIQQVLFEVEGSYLGHPYFVTGNALFNAIARRVDERTRRALHVSHGVFVPGEFGEYPRNTRRTGTAGNSGSRFPMSRRTRICSCSVTRSTGGCWIRGREMRTTRTISSVTVTGWRLRRRVSLGDRRSSEIRSGRCRGSCTATCTGGAMMTSCRSLETCLTGSESAAHATTGSVNCR